MLGGRCLDFDLRGYRSGEERTGEDRTVDSREAVEESLDKTRES